MLHDGFGPEAIFEVYGSVRHGLAIETSDIDVVILGTDHTIPTLDQLTTIHEKMMQYEG